MTSRKRKLFVALFHSSGDTHLLRLHTRARLYRLRFVYIGVAIEFVNFIRFDHNRKELGQVDGK